MSFHTVSHSAPLPSSVLQQIANAGSLDEISNIGGAVRFHIFWHGDRDRTTGQLQKPMLFFIYQTGRHGPQNGFRLCLVHQGFYIGSDVKDHGDAEDEIDRLESEIPQGHMEVAILGEQATDN